MHYLGKEAIQLNVRGRGWGLGNGDREYLVVT